MDKKDLVKEESELLLSNVCKNLIVVDSYDQIGDMFEIIKVDVCSLDDNQVREKFKYMLHTTIFEHKKTKKYVLMRMEKVKKHPKRYGYHLILDLLFECYSSKWVLIHTILIIAVCTSFFLSSRYRDIYIEK